MTPDDLASIKEVAQLEGVLPIIRKQVEKQIKTLETKVYASLDKGELSPQDALNAWIEKRSAQKLLASFETRLRVGQSIGEKNKAILDNTTNNHYTNVIAI